MKIADMDPRAQVWLDKLQEEGRISQPLKRTSPWEKGEWSGSVISLDGAPVEPVPGGAAHSHRREEVDDLAFVLAYGDTGDDWDGHCAGIALLVDGRWCAWDTGWGPTGSGFSEDAYGGDADIWVAWDPEILRERALSAGARLLCGLAYPHELPQVDE